MDMEGGAINMALLLLPSLLRMSHGVGLCPMAHGDVLGGCEQSASLVHTCARARGRREWREWVGVVSVGSPVCKDGWDLSTRS